MCLLALALVVPDSCYLCDERQLYFAAIAAREEMPFVWIVTSFFTEEVTAYRLEPLIGKRCGCKIMIRREVDVMS